MLNCYYHSNQIHKTTILNSLLFRSQRTQELCLLLGGLEPSMSKLGTSINESQVNALQVLPRRVSHQCLTKDEWSLLDTHHGSLEHDPILTDHTVMDKSTHGSDALFGQIRLGLTAGIVTLLSNTVNLLIHFGTMEVSVLTRARHCARNARRMP